MVEQVPFKDEVVGSYPTAPTTILTTRFTMDEDNKFPIEVVFGNDQKRIFNDPYEIPEGAPFKVVATRVGLPKGNIINTGVPKVWGGSEMP